MADRLLAADGESVLAVEGSGSRWVSTVRLEGVGANCLAVSPRDGGLVFAGCRGHGVQRSADGCATFERLDFPEPEVFAIAVSHADGAVYAGCEPSLLFRSGDDGETWEELESLRALPSAKAWRFPPRPWTHHVRAIAPHPIERDLILVGIERGGVVRSSDGGLVWDDVRPGAARDCHALAWHPTARDRAYQAAGEGSAWSWDRGDSWERVDDGRGGDSRNYLVGLAIDPEDADRWYVTAAPTPRLAHGPDHADGAIYRWTGTGPWEKLGGGLPGSLDSFPYALAITDDTLYAGLEDGRIWVGTERAERWRQLDLAGDPVRRVRALTTVPG